MYQAVGKVDAKLISSTVPSSNRMPALSCSEAFSAASRAKARASPTPAAPFQERSGKGHLNLALEPGRLNAESLLRRNAGMFNCCARFVAGVCLQARIPPRAETNDKHVELGTPYLLNDCALTTSPHSKVTAACKDAKRSDFF